MEQAPRLAKAMADGLGVTRGELRALAQDGKLTSEVVINAVQSQGEAIAGEFATLPNTVANSLQVVKNQIFNFIGEIDKTIGQSSKLSEAISYIGDSLEDLDPSLVSALTGVFQNTVETVVELGKVIKGAYDDLNTLINTIASGAENANEKVGLLTASLHGVAIFSGALADGFKAIGIAWDLVVGSLYKALADVVRVASLFSLQGILGKYKGFSDELVRLGDEAWKASNDGATGFESSFERAFINASKTAKEKYTEIAADSEAAYRKMSEDAEATAEQQEAALVKYALDNIKANDNVISDKLRVELAEKNLQAVISETGKVSIESAEKTTASYLEVGQSFAEVALAGKEAGISMQQSLYKAIEGANTKEAVEDIILSLRLLGSQGRISGEDSALGFELANSKLHLIQEQTDANMVAFTDYAAEVIAKSGGITEANQNVIRAQLEQKAAAMGLAVQMSETGGITVTELDKATLASTRTKEQIDELAGAVGIGLSKEFVKSSASLDELISGFDDLTDAGYDAGGALVDSLTAMSDKASNTVEIEALIVKWNELYKEGKITGQELAEGLEGVQNRADILKDGINGVTEAYGLLGLKTREELAKDAGAYTDAYNIVKRDGQATAQQLEESFEKTAKANIASNNGVVDAVTKRMAAERGVTVAVDEQGRVTFEKMGQAKVANDNVTRSVNNIRTAYDGISSSAGSAGNSMVRAANDASSAYDKLQAKIKAVKEAQAVADERTTMQNLRIYGKEEAPAIGDQFGTRLGVENFLKSQGLSEAQAIEEARKLYAKQGTSSGKLDFGTLQGFSEGQIMTTADLDKFKSATVYLAEIAEKARQTDRQRDNYEAARTATAQITTQEYGRFDSQPRSTKTIDVNLRFNGASVPVQVAENQENALMLLLQQLQESKAIAGQ